MACSDARAYALPLLLVPDTLNHIHSAKSLGLHRPNSPELKPLARGVRVLANAIMCCVSLCMCPVSVFACVQAQTRACVLVFVCVCVHVHALRACLHCLVHVCACLLMMHKGP